MPSCDCVRKLRPRYRPFPNTCGAQSNSIDRGQYTTSFSKILQARLQQCVNREIPDVQAGFRKGRGTRDQIANHLLDHRKSREIPEKHLLLPH